MNNLQDMLSLLTAPILLLVALLTGIVKLFEIMEKLWSRLKPFTQYLLLFVTQLIPIGMVIWYYMYWAIQYHSRFTEQAVFLLLVAEPTILIIAYEMVLGIWLYHKLLSFVKQEVNERQSTNAKQNENNNRKSDIKPPRNIKRQ